ncbi:hypothetical protein GCM10009596_29000 [Arthrobacter rhombi]
MAATAAAIVTNRELLVAAHKEHADTIAVTPYLDPIPECVVAPPLRIGGRSAGQ